MCCLIFLFQIESSCDTSWDQIILWFYRCVLWVCHTICDAGCYSLLSKVILNKVICKEVMSIEVISSDQIILWFYRCVLWVYAIPSVMPGAVHVIKGHIIQGHILRGHVIRGHFIRSLQMCALSMPFHLSDWELFILLVKVHYHF